MVPKGKKSKNKYPVCLWQPFVDYYVNEAPNQLAQIVKRLRTVTNFRLCYWPKMNLSVALLRQMHRLLDSFVDFPVDAWPWAMDIWVSYINFYINGKACPPQPQVWMMSKLNLKFHDSTPKKLFFKTSKLGDSSHSRF